MRTERWYNGYEYPRSCILTYSLHDVLQCVQADVASSIAHLGVHGHGKALADGREDKRPFAPDQRHLDGDKCQDRSQYARGIDDDVLLVSVADGSSARRDIITQQDEWQKVTRKICKR